MDIQLEEISKISYKVVRTSRKKTVAIKIQNGKVTILSPKRLSRNRIEAVVLKRSSWILRKLKEAELAPVLKTRSYISGEKFSYLGKKYSLKVITGCPPKVLLVGDCLEISCQKEEEIRSSLTLWYKARAHDFLTLETEKHATQMSLLPESVVIKEYKSRWGSCSSKGCIAYDWRIIMAPYDVVNYLVVHELCHLRYLNHSTAYWELLKKQLPGYKSSRTWLKTYGYQLVL